MVKMAIASSFNTYEDGGICTEELSEKMITNIVYQELSPSRELYLFLSGFVESVSMYPDFIIPSDESNFSKYSFFLFPTSK